MRLRKPRDPNPHAAALAEIDEWVRWHTDAQLQVIDTQELTPDQRTKDVAEAKRLSAAIGERMKCEYQMRQKR